MVLEPFGEVGANFSLQISSRTEFTKINNKKVIAENQCEKHKKSILVNCKNAVHFVLLCKDINIIYFLKILFYTFLYQRWLAKIKLLVNSQLSFFKSAFRPERFALLDYNSIANI